MCTRRPGEGEGEGEGEGDDADGSGLATMVVGKAYLITSADGEDFRGTVTKLVPGLEHNNDVCDCSSSDEHLKANPHVAPCPPNHPPAEWVVSLALVCPPPLPFFLAWGVGAARHARLAQPW